VRYLLGLLAIIGLIIVLIILLIPGGTKVAKPGTSLISYASTNVSSRITIDGPEIANQNHEAVQIDVSKVNVTFEQIRGYNGQVVNQQTFTNTENAYSAFLHSLYYANFTSGNPSTSLKDEVGVCALGDRYIFELDNGTSVIQRYWATSCGGLKTYKGNLNYTISLFESQVPGYANLTSNIQF
jgi:hypothetical protein